MFYNFFVVILLISVFVGFSENYNTEENTPKGFVTSFIKYLDYTLDLLYQTLFGVDTKTNSEDEDETDKVSYKDFHLLRIWPRTDEAVEILKILGEQPKVQLWLPPVKNMSVDVILPPNIVSSITEELKEKEIEYSVLSSDIERIILSQTPKPSNKKILNYKDIRSNKITWTRYHSLDDILDYLDHLQFTYPNIVDIIVIGKSAEGRELKVIRISSGKTKNGDNKPAIWIDGGIHAREWISIAVALFIVRQLVEYHSTYKTLLQDLDWYILPVANPDGYTYSQTTDRLWKKSRSSDQGFNKRYFWDDDECKGVDLNRNFDFRWNEDGIGFSDNPCHETFAGRSPFSEPETKAMSKFILEHRDQIIIYLTLHAYSQKWLMPWSSTKSKWSDYDDLLYMGRKAVESLKKTHGTNYDLMAKQTVLNSISGNSDDWAKSKVGIKYSYTIKLRDRGTYGFLLPPSQILPTGKEIFTAIRTLTKSVLNNTLNKNSKY